jgi:plasmid stabilization system protein ParE
MAKRVIWSRNALEDKLRILDYWNKRTLSKSYSMRLNQSLIEAVKILWEFPALGRSLPNSDIRFIVRDYYQIFYRISQNDIRILHIWDSRRNPDCLEVNNQ